MAQLKLNSLKGRLIMVKGSSISGNGDGSNGENDSYTILGRGVVSRETLVEEVKEGLHPDTHIINVNDVEYARNNPNSSKPDNIND